MRLFTLRAVADGTSLPHRRSPLSVRTVVLEGSWYTLTNSLRLSRGRPTVRSASRESERAAAMMGDDGDVQHNVPVSMAILAVPSTSPILPRNF